PRTNRPLENVRSVAEFARRALLAGLPAPGCRTEPELGRQLRPASRNPGIERSLAANRSGSSGCLSPARPRSCSREAAEVETIGLDLRARAGLVANPSRIED